MISGYKQVSGNSNIAFNYPLRALIIKNDPEYYDYSPEISMTIESETTFRNWMYVRKKRD
jgi:hypothetical protein